jgi:hypothetical protein
MDEGTRVKVAAALKALGVTQSQLKTRTELGHSTCRRILGLQAGGVSVDHIDKALAAYGLTLRIVKSKH